MNSHSYRLFNSTQSIQTPNAGVVRTLMPRLCSAVDGPSMAGKSSHVMVGRVLCSLGVWDDVGRPYRVATVSHPCSCPYGVP